MQSFGKWRVWVVAAMMVTGCSAAEKFGGDFVAEGNPAMSLTLRDAGGGAVDGSLTESGTSVPLSGRRNGNQIRGTIGPQGNGMPFTIRIDGKRLDLAMGDSADETLVFVRAGANNRPQAASAVVSMADETPMADKSQAQSGRRVSINGHRLSDAELAKLEQQYRVHLPDADFWYDAVLGAWGLMGGPTQGFTSPGLNLGAPVPANASGGGTQVFVNGRELHPLDLMTLQRVTGPIMPGRYFINAQGLAGIEGGPPMWNLAAMAGSSGGGGYNSWQGGVLGSSGFSQDGTGAVFLPGGGNVSYGPN